MAIIKKFRIKNFKQENELLKLEKISLSFGKRKILEDLNLSLNFLIFYAFQKIQKFFLILIAHSLA